MSFRCSLELMSPHSCASPLPSTLPNAQELGDGVGCVRAGSAPSPEEVQVLLSLAPPGGLSRPGRRPHTHLLTFPPPSPHGGPSADLRTAPLRISLCSSARPADPSCLSPLNSQGRFLTSGSPQLCLGPHPTPVAWPGHSPQAASWSSHRAHSHCLFPSSRGLLS